MTSNSIMACPQLLLSINLACFTIVASFNSAQVQRLFQGPYFCRRSASKLRSYRLGGCRHWDSVPLRSGVTNEISLERPTQSHVDDIENVYVISDLHTDNVANLEWLRERCNRKNLPQTPGRNDALIIAGDISHEFSKLEETFNIITEGLACHVYFVWGNHEAWIGGKEMDALGIESSLEKIDAVKELCEKLGIKTNFEVVGKSNKNPVCIFPIESWYDGTLALQGCEDLCSKFESWPWVDFLRCEWPDKNTLKQRCENKMNASFSICDRNVKNTGRIPLGLTDWFALKNSESISEVQDIYRNWVTSCNEKESESAPDDIEEHLTLPKKFPGLITFSHFLPNQKTLPDWKDPLCETFQREEWLDHPVPGVSAKFSKVSGSIMIDEQIRSILAPVSNSDAIQHLHIFGHSHRPKDFVYKDIRYVHNPLGKPAEREMKMVSDEVQFQLVWDCTKSSTNSDEYRTQISDEMSYVGGLGEIPGERVIRFWEEKGGGKRLLARRMKHRRQRKRLEVKRFLREVNAEK